MSVAASSWSGALMLLLRAATSTIRMPCNSVSGGGAPAGSTVNSSHSALLAFAGTHSSFRSSAGAVASTLLPERAENLRPRRADRRYRARC